MESFVMAETFKYFYLLFAPPSALDLDTTVLTTEAHPLRKP
jgi:mannosidase alpha-like ER degradation enhancer 2